MKRIVTIQDISCVGKCSLTAALPIISAMGVETVIVPTAVLSNHTAFDSFTFHDLTGEIKPIGDEFKKHRIDFDAIYTGYLGSMEQIDIVSDFIDSFKTEDNFVFVDPAMADMGKLYSGFDMEFAKKMSTLCARADIIVPNMTEAAFMLDIPYVSGGYSEEYVRDILRSLTQLGAKKAVLTGVSFDEKRIGVMSYDAGSGEFFSYFNDRIDAMYHGTGDVFASVCVGALARGGSLEQALRLATDHTCACIKKTLEDKNSRWYGVNFEQTMPELVRSVEEMSAE
ncbi:MAG: pyridoxamine kinase [Oscillospiraceae bacterium]|nr:pyridoxamine kinase [Oscillospiraceae bacterium]